MARRDSPGAGWRQLGKEQQLGISLNAARCSGRAREGTDLALRQRRFVGSWTWAWTEVTAFRFSSLTISQAFQLPSRKPAGELWGCRNNYLADSVRRAGITGRLPKASGLGPPLTSHARHLSLGVLFNLYLQVLINVMGITTYLIRVSWKLSKLILQRNA